MGVRGNRPLQLRDANGAILSHAQDDDRYLGAYISNTVRYHGFARPNTSESSAAWRIYRETIGAGTYSASKSTRVDFPQNSSAVHSNDYEFTWDSSSAVAITDITQANPGVVTTSAAHGYTTGDVIRIEGVATMTEVNDEHFTITVTAPTTFTIVDTSGYGGAGTGGNAYKPDYANSYTWA